MSTASSEHPSPSKPAGAYRLTTSTYDQAASGMVSALLFVGIAVGILLVLYFSAKIFAKQEAVPVSLADIGGRQEGTALGTARDLEEPGSSDIPELMETTPMQSLEAISSAVSSKAAMMDDASLDSEFVAGSGKGKGDSRAVGNGAGERNEMVPRDQRWSIHYNGGDLKVYARQLDFFGIELAAVGGKDNLVHYVFNLAKPKPDRRTGAPDAETRLFMTWRSGALQQADRELLKRAGVDLKDRVVMQFYPASTEQTLAVLEKQASGNRDVNEIRRTVFDVQSDGEGFKFTVKSQQFFN